MTLLNIKLITAVIALAASNAAFANELVDCTGCTPQQFQLAAMEALDGVHIVYDLETGISRKFAVQGVDCNNRDTTASPDKKIAAPAPKCWSGNATVTEMPVDSAVLSILSDMAVFDSQYPGYLQNGYAKNFEINLDSPPAGFSDPSVGGNLSGHHDIVGIALDRNFSNPTQNDFRFNNFENSISNWLSGPNAPDELRGFVSFVSRITSVSIQVPAVVGDPGLGLSWNPSEYLIRVVAKDGFGNEIRMTFDPKTGILTITGIVGPNGNPFPSKFQDQFSTSFPDQNLAGSYVGGLENSGIQVSHGTGGGGISTTRWWQVSCTRTGNGPMTCITFPE